jgi:radical SAM protein with 4Fe4S-binding SPASM domain
MPEEPVNLFLSILENPMIRLMTRFSTRRCQRCGKSYLDVGIDEYLGEASAHHGLTSELASMSIALALNVGAKAFKVRENEVREALRQTFFRRGLTSVLGGIAEYGVTKPQRLASPFLVVWNYTDACNLRCKHCYQEAAKPAPDELSTEERLMVIDQLYEAGVASLAFSGGEPLMRSDFFNVAKQAADRGIYVSLATNGTMVTEQTAEKLKASGVRYVEVSLDGATPQTHDTFRGASCFDRTVEGIRHLVRSGVYTCIATTATKHNIDEIPQIIELAKDLGVPRIIVFNFIPTGRGDEIRNLDLTPSERERLLIGLYTELVKGEVQTLSTAPQYARVCLQQSIVDHRDFLAPTHFAAVDFHGRSKRLGEFIGGCGAGRLYCAIQPNGLVTPCVFMPIIVGDLRRQSLREIWFHSKVLDDLRDRERLKGRCGRCQYKYICGGCRARAYAYHGDYLMPDPGCIRELEEPSLNLLQAVEARA